MAEQYVLQPNGKWAIWSTCTDQLTGVDFTDEELIAQAGEDAKKKAIADTQEYLGKKRSGWGIQFSVLWSEAVSLTLQNSTDEEWKQAIMEIDWIAAENA